MFNGIIFTTGRVKSVKKTQKSLFVGIQVDWKTKAKDLGSSISCNGVCLTIAKIKKNIIYFYVSNETLIRSNLRLLKINDIVNLEKSLLFGQMISGHFMQGHVDSVATVKKINFIDKTWLIKFKIIDKRLNTFLIEKASISINRSIVNNIKNLSSFLEVNVIHTH